eukprot:gene6836-10489_t
MLLATSSEDVLVVEGSCTSCIEVECERTAPVGKPPLGAVRDRMEGSFVSCKGFDAASARSGVEEESVLFSCRDGAGGLTPPQRSPSERTRGGSVASSRAPWSQEHKQPSPSSRGVAPDDQVDPTAYNFSSCRGSEAPRSLSGALDESMRSCDDFGRRQPSEVLPGARESSFYDAVEAGFEADGEPQLSKSIRSKASSADPQLHEGTTDEETWLLGKSDSGLNGAGGAGAKGSTPSPSGSGAPNSDLALKNERWSLSSTPVDPPLPAASAPLPFREPADEAARTDFSKLSSSRIDPDSPELRSPTEPSARGYAGFTKESGKPYVDRLAEEYARSARRTHHPHDPSVGERLAEKYARPYRGGGDDGEARRPPVEKIAAKYARGGSAAREEPPHSSRSPRDPPAAGHPWARAVSSSDTSDAGPRAKDPPRDTVAERLAAARAEYGRQLGKKGGGSAKALLPFPPAAAARAGGGGPAHSDQHTAELDKLLCLITKQRLENKSLRQQLSDRRHRDTAANPEPLALMLQSKPPHSRDAFFGEDPGGKRSHRSGGAHTSKHRPLPRTSAHRSATDVLSARHVDDRLRLDSSDDRYRRGYDYRKPVPQYHEHRPVSHRTRRYSHEDGLQTPPRSARDREAEYYYNRKAAGWSPRDSRDSPSRRHRSHGRHSPQGRHASPDRGYDIPHARLHRKASPGPAHRRSHSNYRYPEDDAAYCRGRCTPPRRGHSAARRGAGTPDKKPDSWNYVQAILNADVPTSRTREAMRDARRALAANPPRRDRRQ